MTTVSYNHNMINPAKSKRKVHFSWMGAYWSCTTEVWAVLQQCVESDTGFNLAELGVRELRTRPKGACAVLCDVQPRSGHQ